jgi:lipid-A-disaccharide synthase
MPGSRSSEVDRLLPEMLKGAEKLQKEFPELQFVLPLAPDLDQDKISKMVGEYSLVLKVVKDYTYQIMEVADLMVTASGTATLESLLIGTPMIILYQTSWSTYQLGSRLINIENIGLPNIIAGREVVPELLQDQATGENIYQEAVYLLKRDYLLQDLNSQFEDIKERLGSKGAVEKTAQLVLQEGGLS